MSTIHPQAKKIAEQITKNLAAQGKLIEGGFAAYVHLYMKDADPAAIDLMRRAWFLSADHIFASLLNVMDADREPTAQDMKIMEHLERELATFRRTLGN
jgi:hypothetical protein